jgi:integrase
MTRARRGHGRRAARGWGKIRELPSGRYQASYLDAAGVRRNAPDTFHNRDHADAWLARQRAALDAGTLRAPSGLTLGAYAAGWLDGRELAARTRNDYARILRDDILPGLGGVALAAITPGMVRSWHAGLHAGAPAARSHAYGLLHAILATAAADDEIPANPARLRGAAAVKRASETRPATLAELDALAAAMPPRLRLLVELAAWCGLRFGELAELRRADIDTAAGVVRVRRGVVRVPGGHLVKGPKSAAGVRDVAIPPHLLDAVAAHLDEHTGPDPGALLFPGAHGGHLAPSALYRHYYPARLAAGRPDLRFHDLRHTGATLAAATGASLAEVMRRLGHSTPAAAMRYQHAADDRDAAIAAALSEFAGARVVELRPRRSAT